MREVIVPNRALRGISVQKLILNSEMRASLILFEELYKIKVKQELSFFASTYNNAVFQLHIPKSLWQLVASSKLYLSVDESLALKIKGRTEYYSFKILEKNKFEPVIEYYSDSFIAQNDYQHVYFVDDQVREEAQEFLQPDPTSCHVSAYHSRGFVISQLYMNDITRLSNAYFYDENFLDQEAKISQSLRSVDVPDDEPIGHEVNEFLDIVGIDKMTFCYEDPEFENDEKKLSTKVLKNVIMCQGFNDFALKLSREK